jgi:hypothetical protein
MLAGNYILCMSMIYLKTLSLAQYVHQITVCFLLNVEEPGRNSVCPHEVDKIYVLLVYTATHSVKSLTMFRDNLSVPSSRVKNFLKKEPIGFTRNVGDGLKLYVA